MCESKDYDFNDKKKKSISDKIWDRAIELGKNEPSDYVRNSIEELLASIYRTVEYYKFPNHYDAQIDKIGLFIKEEFNIEADDAINWQTIEEWISWETHNLTHHLSAKEIQDILKTLKINEKEWEEPTAKMDIEDIGDRICREIKENFENRLKWDKEVIKKELLANL